MLILLPPSETKSPGGDGPAWDASRLRFPELAQVRESVVDALVSLSSDEDRAVRTLKLGASQRADIGHNAVLRTAPTMPAVDRFTGVLFDALDAPSLDRPARGWLAQHVVIQSALFGPIGALDPIPNHRLAAGMRLPGLPVPRRLWQEPVGRVWASLGQEFVLDLRSSAYAELGPVPETAPCVRLKVATRSSDGTLRALNHFNKKAKGELTRALAHSASDMADAADFLRWAGDVGFEIVPDHEGFTLVTTSG